MALLPSAALRTFASLIVLSAISLRPVPTPLQLEVQALDRAHAFALQSFQDLNVVFLLEGQCATRSPTDTQELECLHALHEDCSALGPYSCFKEAAHKQACQAVFPRTPRRERDYNYAASYLPYYKAWYVTLFSKLIPELRHLGWRNVQGVVGFDWQALTSADVVVVRYEEELLATLLARGKPSQRIILVDKADASTLPPGNQTLLEHPKVSAILKQIAVQPAELQRGPLLDGLSHLTLMGTPLESAEYRNWSDATLGKIHTMLPLTMIQRYPWACGSGLFKARFAGFFHPSLAHTWQVPPLKDRRIDVAFLGKAVYDSRNGAKRGAEPLTLHRTLARDALLRFEEEYGEQYTVVAPRKKVLDYPQYLATLLDTKILISPWGWGEWSLKDFEAVMSGCLLLKPMAGRYKIYPDIYAPGVTALSVDQHFANLTEVLLGALRDDPQHAQRMADAAARALLRYSDPAVVAKDFSQMLSGAIERN